MSLLPRVGLDRRVWRSQAWVSGQPCKPWLGSLNSALSNGGSGGAWWTKTGGSGNDGGGAYPWAVGTIDLPYIQQRFVSDSADSLVDFSLPSSTSPTPGDQRQQQQQSRIPALAASWPTVVVDDVIDDVKRHNESFEVTRTLYVLRQAHRLVKLAERV